jgi:hypothetical protein
MGREIRGIEGLLKSAIEIGHSDLNWIDNSHGALAVEVQIFSDAVLKKLEADDIFISISCN